MVSKWKVVGLDLKESKKKPGLMFYVVSCVRDTDEISEGDQEVARFMCSQYNLGDGIGVGSFVEPKAIQNGFAGYVVNLGK